MMGNNHHIAADASGTGIAAIVTYVRG